MVLRRQTRALWLVISAAIAVADVYSKKQMQTWLGTQGGEYEVTFFLNFTSIYNTGAAFGFLADAGVDAQLALRTFSLGFCVAIYLYMMFYKRITIAELTIAALILGGGLGNAYERLFFGRVFDFVDLHLFGWHWPAFNVADMAITLGIALAVWQLLRPPGGGKKEPA